MGRQNYVLLMVGSTLAGCAENVLFVRGNMPGTEWIARQAASLNGALFCDPVRDSELRAVQVRKQNNNAPHVTVVQRCRENSNMTHLKNAPMTQANADRSLQPGSQNCRDGIVVGVALDGDVVLLAKYPATKSAPPNKWHLHEGCPYSCRTALRRDTRYTELRYRSCLARDVAETEEARKRADKTFMASWQRLIERRELTS